MTMKDLLEARAATVAAMREIADAPKGTGGDLSEDQAEKFDQLKGELAGVEKSIERQTVLDTAERHMAGQSITGRADDFTAERRQCSLVKAIAYQMDPRAVDAGREIEVSQELAKRAGRPVEGLMLPLEAMMPATEKRVLTKAGDGSNLIQTEVLEAEFIDALRPSSVAIGLGARTLTDLHGDIALPKMDALTPAAAWVAEDTALSTGDHSFTQVTGSPKHLGALTEYSRKLVLQTSPDIEQIVRADFMAKLGAGVDLAVMKGTGASGQPTGITQTAGIGTLNSASSAPTWANIVSIGATVESNDVPMASLGWVLNAHLKAELRKTVKVTNEATYLMEGNQSLDDHPVAVSSQLAGNPATSPVTNGEAIFGAWNQVIVAFWSGVEILVNPYAATPYSKGNIQVRGIVDADVLVRHPEAFLHWTGVLVS